MEPEDRLGGKFPPDSVPMGGEREGPTQELQRKDAEIERLPATARKLGWLDPNEAAQLGRRITKLEAALKRIATSEQQNFHSPTAVQIARAALYQQGEAMKRSGG